MKMDIDDSGGQREMDAWENHMKSNKEKPFGSQWVVVNIVSDC